MTRLKVYKDGKKLKPSPFSGAILKANDEDWYGDTRKRFPSGILDYNGKHGDEVFPLPDIIGAEIDNDPSDNLSCPICCGTGRSSIINQDIHEKLKMLDNEKNTVDPQPYCYEPLQCFACAGKGKQPIPWGELNGYPKRPRYW